MGGYRVAGVRLRARQIPVGKGCLAFPDLRGGDESGQLDEAERQGCEGEADPCGYPQSGGATAVRSHRCSNQDQGERSDGCRAVRVGPQKEAVDHEEQGQ